MAKTLIDKFKDKSFNKINVCKKIMKYELETNTKIIQKNYLNL